MEPYQHFWDKELENLDEPMIAPHTIPEGKQQSYDYDKKRFILTNRREVIHNGWWKRKKRV